jgi:hypothetical protein
LIYLEQLILVVLWKWLNKKGAKKRWLREYLTTIQVRLKSTMERENVKVGDIVKIFYEDVQGDDWPIERIVPMYLVNGIAKRWKMYEYWQMSLNTGLRMSKSLYKEFFKNDFDVFMKKKYIL